MSAEAVHCKRRRIRCLCGLLLFRHVQVHGYGFTLEDERLVEIARSSIGVCREFLLRLP